MKKTYKNTPDENNDMFRWLADNSLDIINILDDTGQIIYVNPAVTRILGYTQKEIIGTDAFSFIHPDDVIRIKDIFQKSLTTHQSAQAELRIRHKDGSWLIFEVVSKPIFTSSKEVSVIVNSRDITKKKIIEQQKEEFISLVAHELKTPLTVMKLWVQDLYSKLKQLKVTKNVLNKIHNLDAEITRLTGLINEILDVSRLETGKIQLHRTHFSVTLLLEETITEMQSIAVQKIELSKPTEVSINADKDRIKQVLMNLLSNAIKYSPKNGQITVEIQESKTSVTISVTDEGKGIPKEKLTHLFERFYQIEEDSGSGLGLYIAKEIITVHKGKIWVESPTLDDSTGTTFFFSLPK